LRLAGKAIEYLKRKNNAGGGSTNTGSGGYTPQLNTYTGTYVLVEHSEGPLFWRNSFERRSGRAWTNAVNVPIGHLQLDVGVPNGGVTGTTSNVTVGATFTVNRPTVNDGITSDTYTPPSTSLGMVYPTGGGKSGESAFRLAGTRTAGTNASYMYKIAETRIKANNNMALTYWQKAEDALGANVIVDLRSGSTYLSGTATVTSGETVDGWQRKTINIPANWANSYITEVIIAYKDTGTTTGSFVALIDDIEIKNR
jgi:hypothetical protein